MQKEKEKIEKQQKGPSYKVYTMHDYKKLKLEYKLGGLGPSQDPEMLKEKVSWNCLFGCLIYFQDAENKTCILFTIVATTFIG